MVNYFLNPEDLGMEEKFDSSSIYNDAEKEENKGFSTFCGSEKEFTDSDLFDEIYGMISSEGMTVDGIAWFCKNMLNVNFKSLKINIKDKFGTTRIILEEISRNGRKEAREKDIGSNSGEFFL